MTDRALLVLPLLCGLLLAMTFPSAAICQSALELPVARGDVLSVTVVEEPDLDRTVKVNAMGRIMLPRLGSFDVEGRRLDDVVTLITEALSERDIIRAATVVVEVAEYRPFYVDGVVAHPGALAYEPGLTVRHALVLAGGLDRGAGADRLSIPELLALNSEWKLTAYNLLVVNSTIARLEAELNHISEVDFAGLTPDTVAPEAANQIETLDAALLKDTIAARDRQKTHMNDLSRLLDFQLDVLVQQADHQKREAELQDAEFENAKILLEKGLISQPRVRDLEREQSRLARDQLEVQSYTARSRQTRETLTYDLESADRNWRIETRARLRDAVIKRAEIEAKVATLSASLLAAGISLSDDTDLAAPEPSLTIHRVNASGTEETLRAGMSTAILPGDVLDVALAVAPQG